MIITELKGHYENQEWVWDTEFDADCENYVLRLNGGDITPLMLAIIHIEKCSVFCPILPKYHQAIYVQINHILHARGIKLYTLDNNSDYRNTGSNLNLNQVFITNITPNWSKYIPEDSAVLFLDGENLSLLDIDKKIETYNLHENVYAISNDCKKIYWHQYGAKDYVIFNDFKKNTKKISIIVPQIHASSNPDQLELFPEYCHIENLNKIAGELKEKYGVEYVEVVATHCDLYIDGFDDGCWIHIGTPASEDYEETWTSHNINKIITTNSTGILDVQDTESLQVIDCVEFFEEFLSNN